MTDESVKIENCRVAMKAALEAIDDYCEIPPEDENYIKFAGDIIAYPDSVDDIMSDPKLSGEEQIKEIAGTVWAEETATRLCEDLFEGEQLETNACIKQLKKDLASAVLFQRLKWVKKKRAAQEEAYADRYAEGMG